MKRYLPVILMLCLIACTGSGPEDAPKQSAADPGAISEVIDRWHRAAAVADADTYFGLMADSAIYIGTDATERWTKGEFKEWSQPYFERGEAWDFTATSRHIYFSDGSTAWFDEQLDTWMGICNASGVMQIVDGDWKIVHYHLSVTVPNEKMQDVLRIIDEDAE